MARMYRRKGNEAFVERMVPFGISAKKLSATPGIVDLKQPHRV